MIAMTIAMASTRLRSTSSKEPAMKLASSEVTRMVTSGGRLVFSSSTALRTPSEMVSVLELAWRTIPRPMPVRPLTCSVEDLAAGPNTTSATSPTRVSPLMRIALTSSAPFTLASARTNIARFASVRLPAGTSSATVASAFLRSATVRP